MSNQIEDISNSSTGLWINEQTSWQELGSFVHQAGQSAWFQSVYLTQKEIHRVSVLIYWQMGEKEPWCLACPTKP